MSMARLVITAVVVEDVPRARSPAITTSPALGAPAGPTVSRPRARPPSRLGPGVRIPARRRSAIEVEDQIVRLRKELTRQGLDAGAETIRSHLARRRPATRRSRTGAGGGHHLADPDPPRLRGPATTETSPVLVAAVRRRPAQRTLAGRHHPLAAGRRHRGGDPQHPRRPLPALSGQRPRRTITGTDVLPRLPRSLPPRGIPASVLTDNGAIFTGIPRRGGRVALEVELGRLGVRLDHSRPYHPADLRQGRTVPPDPEEMAHRPAPATTVAGLHRQLDRFRRYYNDSDRTEPLDRSTPARPTPPDPRPPDRPLPRPHYRVRHDLHRQGRHRHPAPQQPAAPHRPRHQSLAGTPITLLVDNLHIRVIHRDTGELIRELTLDPTRDYQPRGIPPDHPKRR